MTQALSITFSTAIGCGARRFCRPKGCEGAASLSDRREYDRNRQSFEEQRSLCRRRPGHPDVLYNCVQSENTGLTMSQQKPSGLLSLGRWTAKA
jgi:hypothetical protein